MIKICHRDSWPLVFSAALAPLACPCIAARRHVSTDTGWTVSRNRPINGIRRRPHSPLPRPLQPGEGQYHEDAPQDVLDAEWLGE